MTRTIVGFYPNGVLKTVYTIDENGKCVGPVETYHMNGQLWER